MADHLRKQIRSAVAVALTGLATTGSRVYGGDDELVDPLSDEQIGNGALAVFAQDEALSTSSLGVGRVKERLLEIVVEVHVKRVSAYSNQRDQIIKEVEAAIDGGTVGGAKLIDLRRVVTDRAGNAEKPTLVATMGFEVTYYAVVGKPDVAL